MTIYPELPLGYNVSEIELVSIILNEQVPIKIEPTKIGDYDDHIFIWGNDFNRIFFTASERKMEGLGEGFLPASRRVFLPAACGGGLKLPVGIFFKKSSDFVQNRPPTLSDKIRTYFMEDFDEN